MGRAWRGVISIKKKRSKGIGVKKKKKMKWPEENVWQHWGLERREPSGPAG